MRADGVFRLILNVALFEGMSCERQDKFVRLIAFENGKTLQVALRVSRSFLSPFPFPVSLLSAFASRRVADLRPYAARGSPSRLEQPRELKIWYVSPSLLHLPGFRLFVSRLASLTPYLSPFSFLVRPHPSPHPQTARQAQLRYEGRRRGGRVGGVSAREVHSVLCFVRCLLSDLVSQYDGSLYRLLLFAAYAIGLFCVEWGEGGK